MPKLRIVSKADVEALLSMERCIDEMMAAMSASSRGTVLAPPRTIASLPSGAGCLVLMPSAAGGRAAFGAKVVSWFPDNPQQGVPAIQGFICLFEGNAGAPIALIDAASVTAIRTAAASGLATRLLAREDAKTHTIVGTGVQAAVHAEAIYAARPELERTLVWGRNPEKASRVAAAIAGKIDCEVSVVADLEAGAGSDVVSVVTAARTPILQGRWLQRGAHVNLVGAHKPGEREADTEAVLRSRVYVDLLESAKREAGDLLIPVEEGAFSFDDIIGEIGELVDGAIPGRESARDITLYKSLGIAAQDLYSAAAVLDLAEKGDSGTVIEL